MVDRICDGTRLPYNLFNHTEYDNDCSFFGGKPPLPQGVGWGVVIGAGLAFVIITGIIVWMDVKFGGTAQTSEEFNTAGRSIKTGLTASVIVSAWTWAATLLQSSAVAWKYGVSGPFWYASGATIQVLLFGILALHIKLKAPKAHTLLEMVKARWGPACHLVFLFFCLCTNIIVSAMLILGGAAVTNALTGIDIYAAAFLIPVGVVAYTAGGGLKATFLSAYLHTIILYLALCIFAFGVYGTDKDIGSPSKMFENLKKVSVVYPVQHNKDGSLLTMLSRSGFIFGVINVVGNFGTVFVDQSYWQSAIAAKPSATYKGYILGGLCWFCIPFTLATSLGLAGRALDLPVDIDEVNAGLVPAAVAVHMLGKGGAVLLLIMLFMAVTSTGAAEQIAVASLISYDVYKEYINPKATGKQIVFVSRVCVCAYGVFMGCLAVILFKIGISLGWVYLFMGVVIGSAVFPVYACLTWDKCSANGAMAGAAAGMIAAVIAWLVTCKAYYDKIDIDTLGGDYPMLAGNVTALGFSMIVTAVVSYMAPQNYDWESMKTIEMLEEDGTDKLAEEGEDSREGLLKALQWGVTLTLVLVVLWPLLALPAGVFSKGYFTFWVSISLIWGLVATVVITVLPLWESKDGLIRVLGNMLTGTIPNVPETYGDKASYTGDASVKKVEPAAPTANTQA